MPDWKMEKMKVHELKPHEHAIGYAYPDSEHAKKLNRSKTGCFTLNTKELDIPFETFQLAANKANELGTEPGRWSWDHPQNKHFYPQIFGSGAGVLQNMEQACA